MRPIILKMAKRKTLIPRKVVAAIVAKQYADISFSPTTKKKGAKKPGRKFTVRWVKIY